MTGFQRPEPRLADLSRSQLLELVRDERAEISALKARIEELQGRLHGAGVVGALLAGAIWPPGRSIDPPTEAAKAAGEALIDQALARHRRPPEAASPRRKRLGPLS